MNLVCESFAHQPQFPHLQNAGLISTCLVCYRKRGQKVFPFELFPVIRAQ